MADSAPDPKVEDVLSSVRRLVSGDIPRKERAPLPKGPGALVLTDADRVQKDPSVRTASRSLEARIAELEAAVDDGAEEFEPDGSEDPAQNVPDRIVYTRPPTSDEQANMRRNTLRLSEIALVEAGSKVESEDNSDADVVPAFRHGANKDETPDRASMAAKALFGDNGAPDDGPEIEPCQSVEAPMAENVPTMKSRRADVTVFTNPDDVVDRIEARIDMGEDEAPVAPIGEASEPDAADAPSDVSENMLREDVSADEPDDDDSFDAALSQAVEASVTEAVADELATSNVSAVSKAEVETLVSADSNVISPATLNVEADVFELPSSGGSTETEDATDADPQDTVDDIVEDTATASEPADVQAFLKDDEAVRELVGRLIREELQGELGERITRNVRKLVRREVKRALDARDIV